MVRWYIISRKSKANGECYRTTDWMTELTELTDCLNYWPIASSAVLCLVWEWWRITLTASTRRLDPTFTLKPRLQIHNKSQLFAVIQRIVDAHWTCVGRTKLTTLATVDVFGRKEKQKSTKFKNLWPGSREKCLYCFCTVWAKLCSYSLCHRPAQYAIILVEHRLVTDRQTERETHTGMLPEERGNLYIIPDVSNLWLLWGESYSLWLYSERLYQFVGAIVALVFLDILALNVHMSFSQ